MIKGILFFILFSLGAIQVAKAEVISLSGIDWKIKDIPGIGIPAFCSDWIPASVPGNIQADLETARILKPLWYGAGDKRLYDVAKSDWHYRKDFLVPEDFAGKRIRLMFDGVDNTCEVWLNGRKIGSNPNMFRHFEFDVAGIVKIGETNRLEVRLERIPADLIPYIEISDGKSLGHNDKWRFTNGMQKTVDILRDMKSGTNFGYDWGVNIWTLGIWKDVWLEASGSAILENLKIDTPLSDNYTKAKIQITAAIDSLSKGEAKLKLKISGRGREQVAEKSISLVEGSNTVYTEIGLDDPALWWPNGHGEQNLYIMEATLLDGSDKVLHTWQSRFGVREVRWELTSEAPADFSEKYMAVINGRRIRMIGSNLIPPDLLLARIPERASHLLRMAEASGFTTLRLWGGGVIFTPELYDLADELGIMLILEVPMANIDPEPDAELLKNLDITLPNIIRQVWNHPSIIEYTGGNEMSYGQGGDYAVLKHIHKIFSEVDSGRLFRDTDPAAGSSHGSWNFPLNLTDTVDPIGVYSAWNSQVPKVSDEVGPIFPFKNISDFSKGTFFLNGPVPADWQHSMRLGEFGYQTPAHLEVWQRDIPPSSQWPLDKEDSILIRKNVSYAIVVFDDDTWLEKPIIDFLFGESPDLEFLLKAGQYIGAEGLRFAMDALRRKGAATAGMMTWDFNEPWTNGAGSYLIDYDGRPLMNYEFLKQAVAQLSLSLRHPTSLYDLQEGIRTSLYLSSDAPEPVDGLSWSWKARDRRGAIISTGKGTVGIDPIEVKKLADISISIPEKTAFGPFLLELQLTDPKGKILHERVHTFGLKGVRSPLKGLLADNLLDPDDDPDMLQELLDAKGRPMPEISRPVKQTSLQVEAKEPRREGEEEVLELALTNTGDMTALFCEPKPVLNYRTDLIIENLFTCIPPGERRILTIRAPRSAREGLSLSQTGWRMESWNADPVEIDPSSDMLLALGRKDRMCREFAGYPGLNPAVSENLVRAEGRRPDPGKIPHLLDDSKTVEFSFDSDSKSQSREARLRIHTSDQSPIGAMLSVELNGKTFEARIPEGYGFQKTDPAHLAQAQTTEMEIPVGVIKKRGNILRIKVLDGGWFTWDALDLRSTPIND